MYIGGDNMKLFYGTVSGNRKTHTVSGLGNNNLMSGFGTIIQATKNMPRIWDRCLNCGRVIRFGRRSKFCNSNCNAKYAYKKKVGRPLKWTHSWLSHS